MYTTNERKYINLHVQEDDSYGVKLFMKVRT